MASKVPKILKLKFQKNFIKVVDGILIAILGTDFYQNSLFNFAMQIIFQGNQLVSY